MQMFVLFDESGKTKVTANAQEAKRHGLQKGCRVESCMTQKDYVKNTYYGKTESGEIIVSPGETKFVPFGKSKDTKTDKPQGEPAKA